MVLGLHNSAYGMLLEVAADSDSIALNKIFSYRGMITFLSNARYKYQLHFNSPFTFDSSHFAGYEI
jgi:hypothetical protein